MKLAEWAREQGVTYKTAHRWFQKGVLPVPSEQLVTGTILVHPPKEAPHRSVALYARVSGSDQRADLDRQIARLLDHAVAEGMNVSHGVAEVGSGLNGHRSKLLKLLRDPEIGTIVVEHRDRLARFGTEFIEAALAASGRRLIVVDQSETKDDLVQDMVDVLTSFCARLYGKRGAKNRARRAVKAAGERAR